MKEKLWVVFVFFIYFRSYSNNFANSFSGFKLTSYHDKVLADNVCFENTTEANIASCLRSCLSNCMCTSFQMCGSTCQLCSEGGLRTMRDHEGCSYFNFTGNDEKTAEQQCERGCLNGINCCLTSQPCFNGGTCNPQLSTTNRFTCDCTKSEGYTGLLCQTPAKSCRAYKHNNPTAGLYKIFDKENNLIPVLCDFDEDHAWTLIQSFQLKRRLDFKSSFVSNRERNDSSPNFLAYRMSKIKMTTIAEDSSKWRITCDYKQGEKISYRDYVEATLTKVDIFTFNGNRCVEVDYIDIRGINCTNCTAYMVQSHNKIVNKYYMGLHFDSKVGPLFSCDHDASVGSTTCGSSGEDDFGFYDCQSTTHRCTATQESLTSAWLGG